MNGPTLRQNIPAKINYGPSHPRIPPPLLTHITHALGCKKKGVEKNDKWNFDKLPKIKSRFRVINIQVEVERREKKLTR